MHWLTLVNTVTGLLLLGKGAASVIKSTDTRPRLGRAYNGVLDGGDLSSFSLSRRQSSSPQCGAAANGARCTNNLCCSQWGYCGSSDIYCSNISGCQPAYGVCEGSSTTTSATSTTSTTTTSSSSSSTVTTTTSSTSTSSSSSSSSSSTASPTVVLPPGQSTTTDGTCGNNKNLGMPAFLRIMRGFFVIYHSWRTNIDFVVHKQLIYVFGNDYDVLGDHHKLYQ
ncbi:hypothetical protein J7T55_009955 [Diaporthe amygdali]|uniref:uncharacterized protein n=1 Tax=Phomopsis amygdali TaxID=1214568 RepID=UPI0022FE16B6|nr:uncharacterized protein J7T55_009955 [Diaporthe amygdali]KAJ0116804.1 hypothetical protein J7T55_009955 [Diaporthe amygdali]